MANKLYCPICRKKGTSEYSWKCDSCSTFRKIVILEGVEAIPKYNNDLKYAEEVIISKTVKKIEDYTFDECTSLKTIAIPEGVVEIGDYAFSECYNLTGIVLPVSLKKIGSGAFDTNHTWYETTPTGRMKIKNGFHISHEIKSKLKRIVLPASIEEIGEYAFGYNDMENCYFVPKGSAAAKYAKACEGTIIYANVTQGVLLGSPVIDNTLYYIEKQDKKYVVPKKIEKIAEYAFYGCEKIEELVIPASVKEICAHAFSGTEKISAVTFDPESNLKCIGSKAFDSFQGTMIDLPASVEDIAPDAFPKGCIVSIGGHMPFYISSVAEINKRKDAIEEQKKILSDLNSNLAVADDKLQRHIAAFPNETKEIPELKEALTTITNERDTVIGNFGKEIELLNKNIAETKNEIDSLLITRKKCFFLAFSKKKELDEEIENKQNELQYIENTLADTNKQLESSQSQFARKMDPVKKKIGDFEKKKDIWESGKSKLTTERNRIEKERDSLSSTIFDLEENLKHDEASLEKQHAKWLKTRNAEIERIEKQKQKEAALREQKRLEDEERKRKQALLCEKKQLLEKLVVPNYNKLPMYWFGSRINIVEETFLNTAFLRMINALNEKEEAEVRNRFVSSNAINIERVKEINKTLGLNIEDGITQLHTLNPTSICESYVPERFELLAKRFAAFDIWKQFKNEAKESIQTKRKNKKTYVEDRFFSDLDYFTLSNDNSNLLVFPYCMVLYQVGKPLCVLTYNKAKILVEYTDAEEITDSIADFGELIREQHKYLNKDGSVSHRYKDNPIIKTVRYTTVTISAGQDSFKFPVHTYNDAIRFEQIFSAYCHDITTDLMGDVYMLVMQSADLQDIESAIDNMAKEEEHRRELELQKELEEQQRLEKERKAAEEAAEKKRQAAILRQRELNEERRRQAEEKKKALQLFEDDFAIENQSEVNDQSQESETLFCVEGSAVISNNVFKVVLKQLAKSESKDFVAYFVSDSGDIISNKKKLVSGEVDCEVTLGFVLDSGIDYTQMKKCFLMITTSGEDAQKIEFKMNISFYSDF